MNVRSRGICRHRAGFIDFSLTFLTKVLLKHDGYLASGSVLPELTVLSTTQAAVKSVSEHVKWKMSSYLMRKIGIFCQTGMDRCFSRWDLERSRVCVCVCRGGGL